ncbi:MAG: hypothetical protein MZV65_30845 [Chromatiales bacterium]|nr:hypothetical protein [Chromatiales bacterium]
MKIEATINPASPERSAAVSSNGLLNQSILDFFGRRTLVPHRRLLKNGFFSSLLIADGSAKLC